MQVLLDKRLPLIERKLKLILKKKIEIIFLSRTQFLSPNREIINNTLRYSNGYNETILGNSKDHLTHNLLNY